MYGKPIAGDTTDVLGSVRARTDKDPAVHSRQVKYPRVDPPEVEDQLGQAVREDTPGYIVKAFPKLFPHGTSDFHDARPGLRRAFRFEEWGRCVMLWHDGRVMRHTRFRYWLLDTMLWVMAPGVQGTFSARARRARTTHSNRSRTKARGASWCSICPLLRT